uniref:Uncharacterized protein n=1 Tax=uncultured Candidatus Melainabacteria bacterium TaxID=2682970 RepID=A0A650EJI1_9BACT|nr:hypothetical protein Melaina855_1600 [uncultured Candidatus Melainabacteria bacterium]
MSLFVGSTSSYAPAFQQRSVNPYKDKVYTDPVTGEKTTWKPGLIFPDKEEKTSSTTKKTVTVLGLAAAAVTAFLFRGKLKNVAGKAITYLKNSKIGDIAKKGLNKVQPYYTKVKATVVNAAPKGVDFVKNLFKKAPVTP